MELNEFEKQLMNLAPAEPALDPTAAAYQAGYRTAQRNSRKWQVSSGCLTVIAICLFVFNHTGSHLQPQSNNANYNIQFVKADNNVKFNKTKSGLSKPKKLNDNSYLLLRRRVLDEGLDALPKSSGSKGKVYSLKDMLNS